MGNLNMQEELSATMQSLFYDPTLMTEEERAEQPPCGTPQVCSCHDQEDEGLIRMHEDTPHRCILEGAPYPTLSQEKEGSDSSITFDSDAAPRWRRVQSSPPRVKRIQPTEVPKFAKVKRNKRKERRRRRKKAPSSSPSSPSSSV